MDIKHEGDNIKAHFYIEENEERVGVIEYVFAGSDKFIIEHTEVNVGMEGKGLGKVLVDAVVEYARENSLKIIPLCPFAKSVFAKSNEYDDVLFKPNKT